MGETTNVQVLGVRHPVLDRLFQLLSPVLNLLNLMLSLLQRGPASRAVTAGRPVDAQPRLERDLCPGPLPSLS